MKRYLIFCLFVIPFSNIQATDYFWVGGSGDWSDAANHWATTSGGGTFHVDPPGPDDDVFFDANSFTATDQTVNVDLAPAECLKMDWTNVTNNPELLIATTARLDIYGDLVLVAAMDVTFAFAPGSRIRMQSDNPGNTITSAGQDLVNLRFEGAGTWTLQDALTSSREIIITDGSLNSNGQTINAATVLANGSGISLDLSNSLFTVSFFQVLSASSVVLANTDITATEVRMSPSGIAFNDLTLVGSATVLSGSALSFETLELAGTTENSITGSHTINSVLSATAAGSLVELQAASVLTLNGAMQSLGGSCASLITWRSNTTGNAATIEKSSGSVTIEFVILRDIQAAGGATFTADNSVDLGNTTGWTINAPASQTYYWIGDDGGNWSDSDNWALSTGGTAAGCVPTPADDVVFDANSFNTAVGQPTVVVDNNLQEARSMTWTGVLNKPILQIPTFSQLDLYGNLSLSPAMSIDFEIEASSQLWLKGSGAVTIESAGLDLVNFRIDGAGSFTILDALTSSQELFLLSGTLDLNGFDADCGTILVNGSGAVLDMSNVDVIAATQFRITSISNLLAANSTLTTNSLSVVPSRLTLNEVTINGADGLFDGDNLNLANLTITATGLTEIEGSHTLSGTLFLDNPGSEVVVQSGVEISLAGFNSSGGGCGDQIYLRSSIPGSFFTFLFTGVTPPPAADNRFLFLQDSRVLNGPFEVNESVDLGNTSGWTINGATPLQYYWVGGSGDWDDVTHWSLTSGGMSDGCLPSINDNVIFDNNSFTAMGQEVNVPTGSHYCRTMEWVNSGLNAITNHPTLRLATLANLYIQGSLLMAGSGQMSYAVDMVTSSKLFMSSGETGNQIRSSGLDLINFRLNGAGSWTLLDNLTAGTELFLTKGTLDTDGWSLIGSQFIMSATGTSLILGSSVVGMETMRFNSTNVDAGTSLIIVNELYVTPSGLSLHDVQLTGTDAIMSGSGLTVNHLQVGGTVQNSVLGNILVQGDLSLDAAGSTLTLGSGNTLEVQGDILSSAFSGSPISLRASTSGIAAGLNKASGTVCLEYLDIQDSDAGGGAVFAAVNATDNGNNSGWIFSADPSCAIFLPVECTDFRANLTADQVVRLTWTTAQEKDNDGFELQRSFAGGPFETIVWIDGAGDSDRTLTYDFVDDHLPETSGGNCLYRLMQVDHDGTVSQACNIVSVQLTGQESAALLLYPNPSAQSVNMLWEQPSEGPVIVTIFDALGRIRYQRSLSLPEGRHSETMPVNDWPVGSYAVRLELPNGRMLIRRVVVKR